jgi:CTP synthase (UTP-ammonia lyase)
MPRIALVGDHDPAVIAHQAIPHALALAANALGARVDADWIATESILDDAILEPFDGVWCIPASPYRSMDGALRAIRFARETGRPFLGTCGGFQHAIIEYARDVLGWVDADHAETADTVNPSHWLVIAPLSCSMVEVTGRVCFLAGSRIAAAYGADVATEGYHCSYGINPAFRDAIASGPLRITAVDDAGDVRAVELDGHPFFVATLFQPERAALAGRVPPIVSAFVAAAERA